MCIRDRELDSDDELYVPPRTLPRPPMPERITAKQRRRAQRYKEIARYEHKDDKLKRTVRQFRELDSIEERLKAQKKRIGERRTRKAQLQVDRLFKTKKLSRFPYHEPEVPVMFTEDIPSSFHQSRPLVHPMQTIQDSLRKRNMLEVRKRRTMIRRWPTVPYEHSSTRFQTFDYVPTIDLQMNT